MNIIDIHTHGIGGYDTRRATEEEILKMAEIHGSSGVSAILPTIYPDTIQVMRENMLAVKRAMAIQRSEKRDPPLQKGGRGDSPAAILGIHLEGPFLNPAKCGALNAAIFIEPTEHHLDELLDGLEDVVKIITIAPELDGATRLIRKISDRGIIASMGHTDATYNEAEAGFNAGAKGITHIFNAMRGLHHREPGIAGFGLLNQDIFIEVIADPFHLNPKTLELIFRTKNPDRIILVSDSVKGTKTLECEKEQGVVDDSGRLQGGAMTIAESSQRLIELGFDKGAVRKCISENPEVYLV
ncbi:MAG: hypothetical protein HZC13_06095 [Nitrospirae bacterium]|nr:hypothetical protein [Nitrospirota bacterium]